MQWVGVAMDGEGIVVAKGDNKCGWWCRMVDRGGDGEGGNKVARGDNR